VRSRLRADDQAQPSEADVSTSQYVGAMMAGVPGTLVGIEWRGAGAILTFESPTGPDGLGEVWRVQVDPLHGRRADDADHVPAKQRGHLTLLPEGAPA
jgi:hypothetical protein